MTTTILAPAAAVFTLTGLPADVFGSCSLQPPPPAPAPPAEDTIYTPVAPGISYEALPEIVVVDTSPDQMVGCIFDTADNAQSRLNALFPAAIAGDGVIERRNNDIWVYDGTVWNNVGPTPGPTILNVTSIVLPYNETAIYDARITLGTVVSKFDYALELLSEVEPLIVTLGVTAARVKLLLSEAGALTLTGQAAALLRRYRMVSAAGSFALTGFGAGSNRDVVSVAGAFTLEGQSADLTYTELLDPAAKVLFYTGNGSTGRTITGVGFEPGFVAIKGRNFAMPHAWHDLARGKNSAGYLWIRAGFAAAEQVPSTGSTVSSRGLLDFVSDGWTTNGSSNVNFSGANYMALCLKKGSAVSSNTNGSVTTQVTTESTVEYSAFTYTGVGSISQTIGHGLSGAPDLVFIKRRAGTTDSAWVGGAVLGTNAHLNFTTSALQVSSSDYYQGFSSTVISLGASLSQNNLTYAGWAFKAKSGSSNIGTYTGSGVSASTHAVTLGYTPQFLMLKNITSTSSDWFFFYRPTGGTGFATQLRFNTEAVEATSTTVQFTADGFSVGVTGPGNVSGGTTQALYWALR